MSKKLEKEVANLKQFIDQSPCDLEHMEFCLRLDQLTELEGLSSDCRGLLVFQSNASRQWELEIHNFSVCELDTMIEVLEKLLEKISQIKEAVE